MKIALFVMWAVAASADLAPLLKVTEKAVGKYIIKLKDSADISMLADDPVFTMLGGRAQHRYKTVLRGFSASLTEEALDFVRKSEFVEYVEEDGIARPAYSWGIDRVNQHGICLDNDVQYTMGNKGTGAHVFVLDTGVSPADTRFGGRVIVEGDVLSDGQNGIDCHGHGTHSSGTIGAEYYGIATNAIIHGVRVFGCSNSGYWSDVIAGCDIVADSSESFKVASVALMGSYSLSLNDAIQAMIDVDVAVAVAAGSGNTDACTYSPASATNALTVGATDRNDVRYHSSNYGSCVDIFAPGDTITSTWLNEGTHNWSGTSTATAHAAGVMALLRVAYPCLNGQEIIDIVKARADKKLVADVLGSDDNLLFCH